METTTSRYKDLGPLHTLLLKACPPTGDNNAQSIPALAVSLGVSHQYVYKWIDNNKVPPSFAKKMVDGSDGRCALEDFHPYVF